MIWDSTDSTVERDPCRVAAVELQRGAIRPGCFRSASPMRIERAQAVSVDRPRRSRIPRNRESVKCGTGFAEGLDRRDSRPARVLVHEETEE